MQPQLSIGIAQARHEEFLNQAARRGRVTLRRRHHRGSASPILWEGLTLRLATNADKPALARLAELDWTAAAAPAGG